MDKIYIEPQGGLANRMRVISSYITFAEKYGIETFCVWSVNNELGATFNSLFKDNPRIKFKNNIPRLYSSYQEGWLKRLLVFIYNMFNGFYFVVKNNDIIRYGNTLEPILVTKCKHDNVCMYVCMYV